MARRRTDRACQRLTVRVSSKIAAVSVAFGLAPIQARRARPRWRAWAMAGRVGDYRIEDDRVLVLVLRVAHRREVGDR